MKHDRKKMLVNFKKAHSHIGRIIKMLEDDEYCINIMQQNLAVVGLLKSAHQMLMEDHLNSCFKKAVGSGDERKKREMVKEILQVTKMVNK